MVDVGTAPRWAAGALPPVMTINGEGASPFVLACDHASNRIPDRYNNLGLSAAQRLMHIAWDPGALPVALALSEMLDAPLVHSTVSRLVIDCNRDEDAPDLIPTLSEREEIPANYGLSSEERARRIAQFHTPFHQALQTVLDCRQAAAQPTVLVTVHSFTPVYKDVHRPWPIGLIHGRDTGYTERFRDALLEGEPSLNIGWNQPYSALNGVTYTLEHHGDGRGLPCTMIEIRHDEILTPHGIGIWSGRLAAALTAALPAAASRPAPDGFSLRSQQGGIHG